MVAPKGERAAEAIRHMNEMAEICGFDIGHLVGIATSAFGDEVVAIASTVPTGAPPRTQDELNRHIENINRLVSDVDGGNSPELELFNDAVLKVGKRNCSFRVIIGMQCICASTIEVSRMAILPFGVRAAQKQTGL